MCYSGLRAFLSHGLYHNYYLGYRRTSTPPIYCRIMSWKLEILVHVPYPLLFYEAEFQFGNCFRRTLGRQCIHKTNHKIRVSNWSVFLFRRTAVIGLDVRDVSIHYVRVSWRFNRTEIGAPCIVFRNGGHLRKPLVVRDSPEKQIQYC